MNLEEITISEAELKDRMKWYSFTDTDGNQYIRLDDAYEAINDIIKHL